jgi:hypothetical protein
MSLAGRGALAPHDENHEEIVKRYEAHFCKVLDLSKVGRGCADLLVRITTRSGHILKLVEIKTEDGSLSPAQERFHEDWGKSAVCLVRSVAEVDAHVAQVKEHYR